MINIMITIDDISTHGSGSQSSPPKLTTNCGLVLKGTKHPPCFASSAPEGPGRSFWCLCSWPVPSSLAAAVMDALQCHTWCCCNARWMERWAGDERLGSQVGLESIDMIEHEHKS